MSWKKSSSIVESFSGVRGVFGQGIDEAVASRYALAYLYFLVRTSSEKKHPLIVVGHDTRPSSEPVYEAMLSSLKPFCTIVYLGVSSTPAIEFMVRHLGADGGIIITASHNPPEFAGWKFLAGDGSVLPAQAMKKVISFYHSMTSEKMIGFLSSEISTSGRPSLHKKSSVRPYVSFLLSLISKSDLSAIRKNNFRVVFDPNGGAAIPYLELFSEKLNLSSRIIGSSLGAFHRTIEPTEETLSGMASVLDSSSFGVGFDCDADRAELVLLSASGRPFVLSGNHLLALVVMSVLEYHPEPEKQVVVVNDATSDLVRDIVRKYGARLVEVEVGEANVVSEMLERNSIVGGEGSSAGAIVYPSRCRDGLLGTLFVLRLLAREGITLHDALSMLPVYHTLRANVQVVPPKDIKTRLKRILLADGASVASRGGTSGSIKARFADGFVWFRPSKTEPGLFRVISDSKSKKRAKEILSYGKEVLRKACSQ